ncbi:MAG: 4-phosphopantoate--beta-alanine ligase [Nitrososphaeraceae archaeon]|nr:4-phosphopantoate--beta-alanine ligase [Nitrososphaeraceae archaeon]
MINSHIPHNHPRAQSLLIRNLLVQGFRSGLVVPEGLLAHGRGETFDYLLGEYTSIHALNAINAASALILLANNPVISVNGNSAALCARQLVELANITNSNLEVNLFYKSKEREQLISQKLKKCGAKIVLGSNNKKIEIPELTSSRRHVDQNGIFKADVVLVPLEDGDRTNALVKMGKKVITIDLNPLSRTSKSSTISIIDNIVRAIPEMIKVTKDLKTQGKNSLEQILNKYDNQYNLDESLKIIRGKAITQYEK